MHFEGQAGPGFDFVSFLVLLQFTEPRSYTSMSTIPPRLFFHDVLKIFDPQAQMSLSSARDFCQVFGGSSSKSMNAFWVTV